MRPIKGPPQAQLAQELIAAGHLSERALWQPLGGGRTNQVWFVSDKQCHRVVKLYTEGAGTPLFPNNPQAEALVLEVLADCSLSPRPLFSGVMSAGPVLIYEHQDGSPWRHDTALAARGLKALHSLPPVTRLAALPSAPDGSAALVAQTMAILAQLPPEQAAPLIAVRPGDAVPPSHLRVLLHGDPVPDNLVCPPHPEANLPVFVDWQCPALGDPVLDLALFLSPAMQLVARGNPLSAQERAEFLAAYDAPGIAARLESMSPILHWRMAAYCLWKITCDRPDPAYAPALEAELAALQRATD
jgi:Ser/Thr protein kinase RdoA (MazF antagonist)